MATQSSLIPVSSSALCSRLASRWRSAICVLRYRVSVRSCRCGLGGTKLPRNSPASISWHSHCASVMSVLRPGTCLTCRALHSVSSKSSSRMCQTGCQYTPVASIATCVTRYAASQSRNAINPATVVENSASCGSRRPLSVRNPHARGHLRLVHIERADTLIDRLHPASCGRSRTEPLPAGASRTDESDGRARSGSPGIRGKHPRQTNNGRTGTKSKAASAGNPQILAHFIRPRKAEGQDN